MTASAAVPATAAGDIERVSGFTAQHRAMVASAVDRAILPGVATFRAAAKNLQDRIDAWCASGDTPAVPADVTTAFREAALGFAAIAHLRFGPLRDDNRLPRLAFWPDPRGVVRRQTLKALAVADPNLTTRAGVAVQSAALQGLPALEVLLTLSAKEDPGNAGAFRCRFAAAIAANVATLAAEVDEGWRGPDGWAARILSPGADNATYRSEMESAAEVLKAYLAGWQIVGEQEVTPWIDAAQKGKSWAGLPFERSGLSKTYVEAQVRALDELSRALGLSVIASRLGREDANSAWIENWIATATASLRRDSSVLALPADLAAKPGTDIDPLRRVKFYANGLRQVVGRQIAVAANVLIGFNDLDGD
ncbi:MAG: imelysin family protein [Hyphomicrobiaceae bacterium]|nr:imelysin family protein [Hyphomicrobiaceae bacterium]